MTAQAEKPQRLYYYVAIPNLEQFNARIFSAVAVRLDSAGLPSAVVHKHKLGGGSSSSFYSLWYSQPYFAPKDVAHLEQYGSRYDDYIKRTETDEGEQARDLPSSVVELMSKIHKIRDYTSQEVVLQPVYSSLSSGCWRQVDHLNVFLGAVSMPTNERSRRLISAITGDLPEETKELALAKASLDFGSVIQESLRNSGANVQWARYWSNYNILIIKADKEFGDLAQAMYSLAANSSTSGNTNLATLKSLGASLIRAESCFKQENAASPCLVPER